MTSDENSAARGHASPAPVPAVYPGAGGDHMFASLHGELVPHAAPRHGPEQDLYSVFHARSLAMGWLTPAWADDHRGEWGMNDAATENGSGDRVAWVQVAITRAGSANRPAPVQPFLSCVGDAVERIGVLQLDAVQILVSAHPRATDRARRDVAGELLSTSGWFPNSPDRWTSIQLTLDSGRHADMHDVSADLIPWCRDIRQDVVRVHDVSLSDSDAVMIDHSHSEPSSTIRRVCAKPTTPACVGDPVEARTSSG